MYSIIKLFYVIYIYHSIIYLLKILTFNFYKNLLIVDMIFCENMIYKNDIAHFLSTNFSSGCVTLVYYHLIYIVIDLDIERKRNKLEKFITTLFDQVNISA